MTRSASRVELAGLLFCRSGTCRQTVTHHRPERGESPAADFGALEADDAAVDFLHPAGDLAGLQVERLGNLDAMHVHDRMVAALREDVDQHGERLRFVEARVLAVDV